MTIFAMAGGLIVGPAVVESLGSDLVAAVLAADRIVVLFFIGVALFLSNVVGVPASTSMTAVGAIAGLGLARGTLNAALMLEIVSWWLVSPIIAFWVSGVIGRYFYPTLVEWFAVSQSEGALLEFDRRFDRGRGSARTRHYVSSSGPSSSSVSAVTWASRRGRRTSPTRSRPSSATARSR